MGSSVPACRVSSHGGNARGANAETPLASDDLGKYNAESRLLEGYSGDQRTFFAAYARSHRNPHDPIVSLTRHDRGPILPSFVVQT